MIVETTFQPGTILAEEGKPFKQNLYIVRSGVVAIANDDSVIKAISRTPTTLVISSSGEQMVSSVHELLLYYEQERRAVSSQEKTQ
jgi:signal-transduction protein with cAMP-binding, CBS, and nucleotidyltransferase domain